MSRFGWGGAGVYVCVSIGLLVPSFLWCLALVPFYQYLTSPEISGVGGELYGLNYELYPRVILYYFAHWMVFTLFAWFVSQFLQRTPPAEAKLLWEELRHRMLQLRNLDFMYLLGAVLLVIFFYTILGWDRFIYSDSTRASSTSLFSALRGALSRILVFAVLAYGVTGAMLVLICRRPALVAAGIMACSIIYVPLASRGFSVLLGALYMALLFRSKGAVRWTMGIFAPAFLTLVLLVPLVLRGYEYSGLLALKDALTTLFVGFQESSAFTSVAVTVFSNLSQGFPILVEVVDHSASGPVLADVPFGYLWRSFSPTLSFMDGFASEWIQYNPRVNVFSPFNTISELYGIHPVFSVFFISAVYAALVYMGRSLSRRGMLGGILTLCLIALVTISLFQIQQYQTRTFMRVIYLSYAVGVFGLIFARAIDRSRSRMRPLPRSPKRPAVEAQS